MEALFESMDQIYRDLDQRLVPLMSEALCGPGCSLCCTGTGSIDINTLEGLRILRYMESLPQNIHARMRSSLAKDRKNRKQERKASCPFLRKNRTCAIYAIRPLVCRRLYSLEPCSERGPVLHKEAVSLGAGARDALQRLDWNGYSGHISYVLHLFDEPGFRTFYASGGFDPSRVMDYGKAHKLVIHRSLHGKK
ncbi:putative zinc- or iron-chelating protein [Desulfobotulus alkaliphilus]|uniref:Putative zinc-or iron-chelating protein n=1 Tax=Desulfobotulus alkaliphilus TaxID=622671 RepID=A0A562RVW5_9BACT|nr:YkgJ family cysteine cluster protein [Desulfobotulus alkaliphilus]TWI73255.1 putative zinc- or iron-chelating protein [Desulfobotulus alkaliphilus]